MADKEKMLSDGTVAPVGAENEMVNLDVEEVSIVGRPAIKRKFLIRKSEGVEVEEVDLEDTSDLTLETFHTMMEEKYELGDVHVEWSVSDWVEDLDVLRQTKEYDRDDLLAMAKEMSAFLADKEVNSEPIALADMTKEDLLSSAIYHVTVASAFEKIEKEESYKPTASMKSAAKRGLAWRSEYGRGGTAVGIARARDLVNGKNLSASTVKRMFSFFSRHEVDKQAEGFNSGEKGFPSNGRIAWAMWGSDGGFSWSRRIANRLKKSIEYDAEAVAQIQNALIAVLTLAEASEEEIVQVTKGKALGTLLSNAISRKAKTRSDRAAVVQQLADAAGITTEAVYMITTGKIKCPPQKRLAAFAKVLNISESSLKSAARNDGCKLSKEEETMNKLFFDAEKQAICAEIVKEDGSIEVQEVQQEGLLDSLKKHFTPVQEPEAPSQQVEPKDGGKVEQQQKSEQESDQLRKEIENLSELIKSLSNDVKSQKEHIEKLEKAAPLSSSDEKEQTEKQKKQHPFKGIL